MARLTPLMITMVVRFATHSVPVGRPFLWDDALTMGLDCNDGCREVPREVGIAPFLVLPCSHLSAVIDLV